MDLVVHRLNKFFIQQIYCLYIFFVQKNFSVKYGQKIKKPTIAAPTLENNTIPASASFISLTIDLYRGSTKSMTLSNIVFIPSKAIIKKEQLQKQRQLLKLKQSPSCLIPPLPHPAEQHSNLMSLYLKATSQLS